VWAAIARDPSHFCSLRSSLIVFRFVEYAASLSTNLPKQGSIMMAGRNSMWIMRGQ